MTNKTDFRFLSSDGKTKLHGISWVPTDVEPKAVLQISHGVAEYVDRYDRFARFLNEHGIIVVGHDHLGHGHSVTANGTPVYFGDGNTWNTVVDDIYVLHTRIKEQYPNLPLLIMGHSMGSFLTRTYLIRYPGTVKAAIIMGTGWQDNASLIGGMTIAKTLSMRGADKSSNFVTSLAFGPYLKPFMPVRTELDWLSVDTDNVDAYLADPLCGAPTTVGLFYEMLSGIKFNQATANIDRMAKDMPLLLISGAMDPVGGLSKGVQHTYDVFKFRGIRDVSLKLYPDLRHEILNEKSQRDQVQQDILNWIEEKLV